MKFLGKAKAQFSWHLSERCKMGCLYLEYNFAHNEKKKMFPFFGTVLQLTERQSYYLEHRLQVVITEHTEQSCYYKCSASGNIWIISHNHYVCECVCVSVLSISCYRHVNVGFHSITYSFDHGILQLNYLLWNQTSFWHAMILIISVSAIRATIWLYWDINCDTLNEVIL